MLCANVRMHSALCCHVRLRRVAKRCTKRASCIVPSLAQQLFFFCCSESLVVDYFQYGQSQRSVLGVVLSFTQLGFKSIPYSKLYCLFLGTLVVLLIVMDVTAGVLDVVLRAFFVISLAFFVVDVVINDPVVAFDVRFAYFVVIMALIDTNVVALILPVAYMALFVVVAGYHVMFTDTVSVGEVVFLVSLVVLACFRCSNCGGHACPRSRRRCAGSPSCNHCDHRCC